MVTHRAADMRLLHFGNLKTGIGRKGQPTTGGDVALHIQCPWRIEGPNGIVTGRGDLWEPSIENPKVDFDKWNYEDGNLQDRQFFELLKGKDKGTGSPLNLTDNLVVESVQGDNQGGFRLALSGGYVLAVFPHDSHGESWRMLTFSNEKNKHFVVSAENGRTKVS